MDIRYVIEISVSFLVANIFVYRVEDLLSIHPFIGNSVITKLLALLIL